VVPGSDEEDCRGGDKDRQAGNNQLDRLIRPVLIHSGEAKTKEKEKKETKEWENHVILYDR
jgi:hypothetical protein